MFLPPDQVAHVTEQLSNAAPLLSGLAPDPTPRGLVQALVGIVDYAKQGYVSFDDMARPLNLAAAALEGVAQGRPVEFSWRTLARGDPRPLDLHRFVDVRPVLDQSALEPGGKATAAIREILSKLGLQASPAPRPASPDRSSYPTTSLPAYTKERQSMASSRVSSFWSY